MFCNITTPFEIISKSFHKVMHFIGKCSNHTFISTFSLICVFTINTFDKQSYSNLINYCNYKE